MAAEDKQQRDNLVSWVHRNWMAFRYAPEDVKGNREVVLEAIRSSPAWGGYLLEWASDNIKSDEEVVLAAVSGSAATLRFAAEELRADREFMLQAVRVQGAAVQYAAEHLKADKEVVLAALQQNGCALQYASPDLRADKEVVLAAVQGSGGFALAFAAESRKGSASFLREVVTELPDAFGDCFIFHVKMLSGRTCGCILPNDEARVLGVESYLRDRLLTDCAGRLELGLSLDALLDDAELLSGELILEDAAAVRALGCGQVHELQLLLKVGSGRLTDEL